MLKRGADWARLGLLLLQLAATAFLGLLASRLASDNSIERFAVAEEASEQDYAEFRAHFPPANHFLVSLVYVPGDNADNAEAIFTELGELPGIQGFISQGILFPEGRPAAQARLPFPFFIADKGCYTGIFQLDTTIDPDRTFTSFIALCRRLEAAHHGGLQRVAVAGEPVVNHYLNLSAHKVKKRFFPLLVVMAIALLGVVFRSVKVLLVTGLGTATALAATMGIMALTGQSLNLVTILVPSLVFVLSIAMNVHVLISIARCGDTLAGLRAKLWPNMLVSTTTSIGFASLLSSKVEPIAVTGGFMALGMWLIFISLHLSYLSLGCLLKVQVRVPTLPFRLSSRPLYRRLIGNPWILVVPVLVIVAGTFALVYNPMESNGLNYFGAEHPVRRDTLFLQQTVTGASQLELLVKRVSEDEPEDEAWMPPFEETLALEQALLGIPGIRHILSLVAFAEANDEEAEHPIELDEATLSPYFSKHYYRIQMLVDSMGRDQYEGLRRQVEAATATSSIEGQFVVTGTLDRLIDIQRYLLGSLARSLLITVLSVVLLMILLLDNKSQFFVILVPNLFPLGCMALAMTLFGMPTTVSSVMVFSIAFGISVDDSIHLLHTYHGSRESSFRLRWRDTLRHDARAVSLTTLVLTLGFMVLALSSFSPTRDFGVLLALGMICAFIGDVIFLPAILRAVYRPERL